MTSRKFWLAIVGFVTGLLVYFGKTAEQAEQIAGLIMSGATVIAYILGEGLIDAAGAKLNEVHVWENVDDEKPPADEE